MLSSGIVGVNASGDDDSETVFLARPAQCLLKPSPIESGIDFSLSSVTGDDVLKFQITDDFEKLGKEMKFEIPAVSNVEIESHGNIFSHSDCVESLGNGVILNSPQQIFDVHNVSSEEVLLQDRNFLNISASSWQSDNYPATEKDSLDNMANVEELIDLFVKSGETEEEIMTEESLFFFLDTFCPLENEDASLFPPTEAFSSSALNDCTDNIRSSFMDYSDKSLTSYAVCCDNSYPRHILDCNFDKLLPSNSPCDVSLCTTEPALHQAAYTLGFTGDSGSVPELRCRKRARDRSRSSRKHRRSKSRSSRNHDKFFIKQKVVSAESKVLSVSGVQNSSSHFESLSKIESEGLSFCSLSEKVSEQVQLAASGNGFISEFAKFIKTVSNHDNTVQASESPQRIISDSVIQNTEFQNREIHVPDRQSKQNCVRSRRKEDSEDCLSDLSFTRRPTSSRRLIQKPTCACCMTSSRDSVLVKVNNSRKRLGRPARHQNHVKDTEKSRQHLQYVIAVDAYVTCQEQLHSLQRKLFHLLRILFPRLPAWKYTRPHSHSLELLVDEINDSLKESTHKMKARTLQPCCPIVTLCRFPVLCLRSLQRKATVLINLLIPSLHIGDRDCGQLESIIDQLISSNAVDSGVQ